MPTRSASDRGQTAIVTAHLWRLSRRDIPWALRAVARDRRRVRALPGARFVKLLGTSHGFTPFDADLQRWLLISAWPDALQGSAFEDSVIADGWHDRAVESWRAVLRPLSSRGRWAGREPFGTPTRHQAWAGPVAALTRARLSPRRAVGFWRSVPAVVAALDARPGLLASFGFGEAPLGYQGTFSVWSEQAALQDFAYRTPHKDAIARSARSRWFAEELFARFAVLDSYGTIDGCDPLNGRHL